MDWDVLLIGSHPESEVLDEVTALPSHLGGSLRRTGTREPMVAVASRCCCLCRHSALAVMARLPLLRFSRTVAQVTSSDSSPIVLTGLNLPREWQRLSSHVTIRLAPRVTSQPGATSAPWLLSSVPLLSSARVADSLFRLLSNSPSLTHHLICTHCSSTQRSLTPRTTRRAPPAASESFTWASRCSPRQSPRLAGACAVSELCVAHGRGPTSSLVSLSLPLGSLPHCFRRCLGLCPLGRPYPYPAQHRHPAHGRGILRGDAKGEAGCGGAAARVDRASPAGDVSDCGGVEATVWRHVRIASQVCSCA